MADTFGTLKERIAKALGRPGDSAALEFAGHGLNAGTMLMCLTIEPDELKIFQTVGTTPGAAYVDLSALSQLVRVDDVYNSTAGGKCWRLPYEMLRCLSLPTFTVVTFYSVRGLRMYTMPVIAGSNDLLISFFRYPSKIVSDATIFPYSLIQEPVVAFAQDYVWACLEEPESAGLWDGLLGKWNIPLSLQTQIKTILKEEGIHELQRAMLTGTT